MRKYFFFIFFVVIFTTTMKINAFSMLENYKIFNVAATKELVVYEYGTVDTQRHSIAIYFIKYDKFKIIKNNYGEDIDSDVYFPSISQDSKYITFTSRATNITDEESDYCYNVLENKYDYCSKIYIYDIYNEKSYVIKNDDENLNGDCYISKISGNGRYVVFESVATNNVNFGNVNECLFNGQNICTNIFKYDFLSKNIILVSTDNENYGGNHNSISPTISYDGRYIAFQSASSNIIKDKYNYNSCKNVDQNGEKICTYVFLYDSKYRKNIIITSLENELFNDNSGNPMISGDGSIIAYETYSSNSFNEYNNRLQVAYYSIKLKKNYIVSQNNKFNNRDTFLKDISDDGNYILFETSSTNLNNKGSNSLYVYGVTSNSVSFFRSLEDSGIFAQLNDCFVYYFEDAKFKIEILDSQAPSIKKDQIIYVVKDTNVDLKEKIIFSDNLSSNDLIQLFSKNNLIFNTVGRFEVEIFCVDEFDNASSEFVTIVVVEEDVESPLFIGEKEIKVLKGSETLNLSLFIKAEDKIDGYTRIYIIDDGDLDLNKSGKYRLSLMSKDNANNISYQDVSVIVYENYNHNFYYEIIFIVIIFFLAIFSIIKVKH